MSHNNRESVPILELKEMGDLPVEEAPPSPNNIDGVRGRQLIEEDQKERLQYFQAKHEIGSGSTDSDSELQGKGKLQENLTKGQLAERLDPTGIQSPVTSSSASNSQTSQVLDVNRNPLTNPSSGSDVFSLSSDHSSFVVSKLPTVSTDNGGVPSNGVLTQSNPLSSALPLSSKVSEELSKLSVLSEVTTKPDSRICLNGNHVSLSATKQEAVSVPHRFSVDGEYHPNVTGIDHRTESEIPHSSKNGFFPLTSRGEETVLTDEDDNEICDILVLFHENDESHLRRFQDICDKYKWTTKTKDDFPLGELGFQQLEEELEKCILVVALMSANFLENGVNSHEHHSALMKSIKEKSKKFIPVVCDKKLKLPSYIDTMTVGNLNKPSFEKQLKTTVSRAKRNHESSRQSLPLNNFDTHQTVSQENKQQGPRSFDPSGSAPCIFRRLQGDLSPGPYAQKFFSDEPFRELCLVLDLVDSLGTPYWHKLAEFIGLMQQDIVWLHRQGRCAANVLEVYFCRRSGESPAVVLTVLMNILEKELDHLQAAGIVRDELHRVADSVSSRPR